MIAQASEVIRQVKTHLKHAGSWQYGQANMSELGLFATCRTQEKGNERRLWVRVIQMSAV